jgi:uncharacterized protein (DUF486 family)
MERLYILLLLVISNIFMTFAWYGHLKLGQMKGFEHAGLFVFILISWGLAFFEYCFQVPANRFGFRGNGGPFSLVELKVIQEVTNLTIFVVFVTVFFRNEALRWNHFVAFALLVLAVYFLFRK